MTSAPCIHCQALAAEVQELRAALGLSGQLSERRQIERRFGLTVQQAKLVQTLYDAGGRVVPVPTLDAMVLGAEAYERGSGALKTVVSAVRAKIGADAIDNVRGGYAMTPVGRALVYTALKLTPGP